MNEQQKNADGCFSSVEFVGPDRVRGHRFGSVRFSAKVQSRTTFRVEGVVRRDSCAAASSPLAGRAPLTIGREYPGMPVAELYSMARRRNAFAHGADVRQRRGDATALPRTNN